MTRPIRYPGGPKEVISNGERTFHCPGCDRTLKMNEDFTFGECESCDERFELIRDISEGKIVREYWASC